MSFTRHQPVAGARHRAPVRVPGIGSRAVLGRCCSMLHQLVRTRTRSAPEQPMTLTVPEAARRVGRNPETIRRWIRAGKLPSSKVGTQHVIDEEDLADAIRGVIAGPLPALDPDRMLSDRSILLALHQGRAERAHEIHEAVAPYLPATTDRPAVTTDPWLSTIVGRIVRLVDPVRIVLFGSRASCLLYTSPSP